MGLIIGLFVAGILHEFLPRDFLRRNLREPNTASVIKASAFGMPLPLCSCSVIPVGTELHRAGASKGATASFLITTPEIGIDSFALSYALLGPYFAIARAINAFLSGFIVGVLVNLLDPGETKNSSFEPLTSLESACCTPKSLPISKPLEQKSSLIFSVIKYSFDTMLRDLAPVLVLGFILSAALSVVLPVGVFADFSLSPTQMMLAAAAVSLPIYICATSSTPLAAVLMDKGLSAGAAMVFLSTGPASNISTMLAIKKELGRVTLAIYIAGVVTISMITGWCVNLLFGTYPALLKLGNGGIEHNHHSTLSVFAAAVLSAAIVFHLTVRIIQRLRTKPHAESGRSCCSKND